MPNYVRRNDCGGYYFFTVRTYAYQTFLTEPAARTFLRRAWKTVSVGHPFEVTALCLLPDHLHCIWRLPQGDSDFSTRWRLIKALFSRQWIAFSATAPPVMQSRSRDHKREVPVWQRRFWEHQVRDFDDLERHCHYIHYNPVKHGYCHAAIDWPWSTYRRFVRDARFLDLSKENLDWFDQIDGRVE
jgi:putative transposase